MQKFAQLNSNLISKKTQKKLQQKLSPAVQTKPKTEKERRET